jgi:hypothetical protein
VEIGNSRMPTRSMRRTNLTNYLRENLAGLNQLLLNEY